MFDFKRRLSNSSVSMLLYTLLSANGIAQASEEVDVNPIQPNESSRYLEKFTTYWHWAQQLPSTADSQFIAFIENSSPLTDKLRNQWLYQLARSQNWADFNQYYRPSTDLSLRCYKQLALYQLGQHKPAIEGALPLWLTGQSQPTACNTLFTILLQNHELTPLLIEQRTKLALQQNNSALAIYLLQQLGPQGDASIKRLQQISQNPQRIMFLKSHPLQGDLYLYGLKLSVARKHKTVLLLWHYALSQHLLTNDQQQQFLAYLALYKAMRNEEDALTWLQQVKANYYSPALKDWEIRYALAHQNWQTIVQLTNDPQTQKEPNWQYWRARALNAVGNHTEAAALFQILAKQRHYYGFLASVQCKQTPQFQDESTTEDTQILLPYQTIIDSIATHYQKGETGRASKLLNDFNSELPKAEKSALIYWVTKQLQWSGMAVYVSSHDDMLNNQLSLRFPLIHQSIVQRFAGQYHIASALIFATIRQESTFFADIRSPVGAYGLMQVLPKTAGLIAKQAKIPYANAQELFTPEKNIQIGTAYLQVLSKQYGMHPILIMAAYNAGPRQVSYWLKHHPPKDIDIWIETLPWQETRNYLKNIIAFYAVYQHRMNQTIDLSAFLQPLRA